ncbi:MAG: hypothetical protein ACI8X5_004268 [Planctomycetota bacterium]|jgi:hypothetical protein
METIHETEGQCGRRRPEKMTSNQARGGLLKDPRRAKGSLNGAWKTLFDAVASPGVRPLYCHWAAIAQPRRAKEGQGERRRSTRTPI